MKKATYYMFHGILDHDICLITLILHKINLAVLNVKNVIIYCSLKLEQMMCT
jgi:hypothetical protein